MKINCLASFTFLFLGLVVSSSKAQTPERKVLTWEQKVISLNAVLEENGPVAATFYGVNLHQDSIWITDVITDCGCTAVGYSTDTLLTDKIAALEVVFDPDHRGGEFTKAIIVKTNVDPEGDTLFLEGINMRFPENPEMQFPYRHGSLGFKLPAIHMGNVLTNIPKSKFVEIYNFGKDTLFLDSLQPDLPNHVQLNFISDHITPSSRGVLEMIYDGAAKEDLGFFEYEFPILMNDGEFMANIKLMATIFEYFDPVPRSLAMVVPKLKLTDEEIDLKEINSRTIISKTIRLENSGQEDLYIRKVTSNCACLEIFLNKEVIEGGGAGSLDFTFDPKGRRGIDHKHITLFTNDPIQPVRTIVIKSSVK
jgi:hypothetical protein